jgi:hypothetical protein
MFLQSEEEEGLEDEEKTDNSSINFIYNVKSISFPYMWRYVFMICCIKVGIFMGW